VGNASLNETQCEPRIEKGENYSVDNTGILYNAVQRTYRNAVVELIRTRFTSCFGNDGIREVRSLFAQKDPETKQTYWEKIKQAAQERRSGGTEELSTPIRDEYELLGVEHFFTVFEKHFPILCPDHAGKPKKEMSQARQSLVTFMKHIKNVRDPVSHPVTDDIDYADSAHVLYCTKKVLDFCGLADASSQIVRAQTTLLGGIGTTSEKILAVLPPMDEVVLDFVGRNRELGILNQWIADNRSRRWALSGEGGKGKSAIAFAFAKSVAAREDHDFDAAIWMSAKRRRFIEGKTVLVDRPDFFDKGSASCAILRAFGENPAADKAANDDYALSLLSEFRALLIVDDIDTLEAEGEDAIQFLVMTIPERTQSRVLVTSRRAIFGMGNLTTQISGLSATDAEAFVRSRCDLMGLSVQPILNVKEKLFEVTDSSPLFIEDLLRLAQSGLAIEKAMGLWAEKRGTEARRYAMQREYEQLSDDAKQVLLALSVQGSCRTEDLCRGLDWQIERLLDALQQLRKMFLMPRQEATQDSHQLTLNNNIRTLVRDVFKGTEAFRRTERTMRAASGHLQTKRSEDQYAERSLRRCRLLTNQLKMTEALDVLREAIEKCPGRGDVYGTIAWVSKRNGNVVDARMYFKRAHELGCRDIDAYWHWSEMEAANEEWKASAEAAERGLAMFAGDQGLLFRHGYAIHRQGKELFREEGGSPGVNLCRRAQQILEKALAARNAEDRNYSLRAQIYRAIVLNMEVLDDGRGVARFFAEWSRECPADPNRPVDFARLRQKFPQYLREH
jgi:tetratricopeptide (TPR) repeat protein